MLGKEEPDISRDHVLADRSDMTSAKFAFRPWRAARIAAWVGIGIVLLLQSASVASSLTLPRGYNAGRWTYGDRACHGGIEDPLNVVFYGVGGPTSIDTAATRVILGYGIGSDGARYQDDEGGSDAWYRDYYLDRSNYLCTHANSDQLGTDISTANRDHSRLFQQSLLDCSRQPYLG